MTHGQGMKAFPFGHEIIRPAGVNANSTGAFMQKLKIKLVSHCRKGAAQNSGRKIE
jgi:hypothetical protein